MAKFPLLNATIHINDRSTDHHPTSCTLSAPPTPFHPSTVTKRVFKKLNKKEIATFTSNLQELSDYCFGFLPRIYDAPLSVIQKYTDTVIEEISSYYHHITSPRIQPDSKTIETVRQALNDLPSPTHPQFSAKMAHLNDTIDQWDEVYNRAQRFKVHRCLVQKTNKKRTLNEAANPSEHRATALGDLQTSQRTHNVKRLTKILSDTHLTLGGPLQFVPDEDTTTGLLQHTPQCTPATPTAPLPDITWNMFSSYLSSCKAAKAGGRDSTSGYLFHLPPEPVKRLLLAVCNIHLNNGMPVS